MCGVGGAGESIRDGTGQADAPVCQLSPCRAGRLDRPGSATQDQDTPGPPSFPGQLRPGSDRSPHGVMPPRFLCHSHLKLSPEPH